MSPPGRGRRSAIVTAILSALIVVAQQAAARVTSASPKRGLGLGLGVFAALVFLVAMLYPARRPRARPLRSAQDWLALHVHLSFLGAVAALAHAGLRPPRGAMGWLLIGLTLLATLSGLLGLYLQRSLPARTAEGLRTQALYDRIPEHLDALVAEADERLSGAGEALDALYESEIRPQLLRLRPRWAYLQDVRADRDSALLPLQQMAPFVADEDKARLDDLISLYTQKLELDAHRSVQWVLRHWLALHALPGGLLLAALAVHVFTWLWY